MHKKSRRALYLYFAALFSKAEFISNAARAFSKETDEIEKVKQSHEGDRMSMIDKSDEKLGIVKQAELLGINRTSLYYKPVPISDDEYLIKRIIDEVYTAHPEFGYRRMMTIVNQ